MGIEKVMAILKTDPKWEELQFRAAKRTYKKGKPLPISDLNKNELDRKIRDFSTHDGVLLISNSERKKLIEKEIDLNAKKK